MANPKKGCGFLVTALILLIAGGIIATMLGKSAFNSGKDLVDEIRETGISFTTPETATYVADETNEDGSVSVWLAGDDTNMSNIVIHVTDTTNNKTTAATKPSGSAQFNSENLVAAFTVEQGKTYQIKASGIEDGRHFTITSVSTGTAISMVGKGFGAIISFGIFGLLALIFGIIGLIKFLSSKGTPE